MLLLLAAGALGHHGADAHQLAAVVEFIHTSTLLHDDVVDESDLRRGRKTANAVWGNAASVLVGDFLYSRSFQLMVELERMDVQQLLADTTNMIAEGEVYYVRPAQSARGNRAVYEVAQDAVTFTGNVVVASDENVIRGETLVLQIGNRRTTIRPTPGQRVRGVFVPRDNPQGGSGN